MPYNKQHGADCIDTDLTISNNVRRNFVDGDKKFLEEEWMPQVDEHSRPHEEFCKIVMYRGMPWQAQIANWEGDHWKILYTPIPEWKWTQYYSDVTEDQLEYVGLKEGYKFDCNCGLEHTFMKGTDAHHEWCDFLKDPWG